MGRTHTRAKLAGLHRNATPGPALAAALRRQLKAEKAELYLAGVIAAPPTLEPGQFYGIRRTAPDWSLVREVVRRVHAAPGGGLHRRELAEAFHLASHGPAMREALSIAYRHRKIDFCWQYVVRPPVRARARADGQAGKARAARPLMGLRRCGACSRAAKLANMREQIE